MIDQFIIPHIYHIAAVLFILAACWALKVAVVAWSDIFKISQEEQHVSTWMSSIWLGMTPRHDIEMQHVRARLQRGGLRGDNMPERFALAQGLSCLSGFVVGLLCWFLHGSLLAWFTLVVLLTYVGLRLPDWWLDSQIKERQQRIGRALPNVIDLLVLCMDVGLSVESAFARVTSEMQTMEPLMAQEAEIMLSEMSAGLTFPQALKRLADRVGNDDLLILARIINQAASLGASITQALREHAEANFARRTMALEEYAGKVSAWLVMPLTVCLLPAIMIVLGGPAIVQLFAVLRH